MIIYGLSGKSGTGKSYNAIELCARMGIEAIVDDGLFIVSGKIVAGTSAKKQRTKIRAIKTAIFEDEEQSLEVRKAIAKVKPKSILVIGTSDRMVDIISGRLQLPPVTEYVHIEDITTDAQRAKAQEMRDRNGMHVIPAPTLQVRKQFSGYFLNPRRSFRQEKPDQDGGEKTVMRPKYSYLGKFEISEKVISDIVGYIVSVTPGVSQVIMAGSSPDEDNNLYIRVIVTVEWGSRIRTAAYELQKRIVEEVSRMTNFNINGVSVEVRGFKAKGDAAG
ncbi:MAG: Asp23/Gls24 family envelope stress response protein [Clostridia bacterium]|nr:Asp23/Gls24 family envelope stress response protein [Clostridia bacterium]